MENLDELSNENMSLNLIAGYESWDSDSDEDGPPPIEGNEDVEDEGLSVMVLKNNIINACAHGPLSIAARTLPDVDVPASMIIGNSETEAVQYEVTEYRDLGSDSDSNSDSSSTDSDVDSVKDIEEISASDDDAGGGKAEKPEIPRVKGELCLDDLPPIEDLAISLPAQDTAPIGTIVSIIDKLVIVRALPGTPAVDLDSVLFLEKGAKALGKVFDVFGPVIEPHYCVRFNSFDHVKDRGVQPGMDVYIAPQTLHTNYVFLSELMKIKGSDASWLNDVEPPANQVEFSDDEEEKRANRLRKERRRQESEPPLEVDKRKPQEAAARKAQRPSDGSSRFGNNINNKVRNPFSAGSRRNVSSAPRSTRPPWSAGPPPGFTHPPPGFNAMTPPRFDVEVPPGFNMTPPVQYSNTQPYYRQQLPGFGRGRPLVYTAGPSYHLGVSPFYPPHAPAPPPGFGAWGEELGRGRRRNDNNYPH